MATHHGRPAGRMLEVGLALVLAAVSGGALVAGLVLSLTIAMAVLAAVHSFSPGAAAALMAGSGGLLVWFVRPILSAIWKGLAAVWRPFLTYYRYEAHTLRPLKEDETNDRDAH